MQATNTEKTYATRNIFGPIIFKMTADPKKDFSRKQMEEEKKRFIEVMTQKMDKLEGNISLLNNIYLEIYANPVKNQLKL